MVVFFISGPFLCCYSHRSRANTPARVVMWIWALLTAGTIVGGGLMMKVAKSFLSESTLLISDIRYFCWWTELFYYYNRYCTFLYWCCFPKEARARLRHSE